jgi:hypothetical protein
MRARIAGPLVIALVVGLGALSRFSQGVESVNVVGLFAGGMATGAALVRIVMTLRGKIA